MLPAVNNAIFGRLQHTWLFSYRGLERGTSFSNSGPNRQQVVREHPEMGSHQAAYFFDLLAHSRRRKGPWDCYGPTRRTSAPALFHTLC